VGVYGMVMMLYCMISLRSLSLSLSEVSKNNKESTCSVQFRGVKHLIEYIYIYIYIYISPPTKIDCFLL